MKINNTIFKAYDIRGVVGKELDNEIMYSIGIVFGQQALQKKIKRCVIGRDGRKSGKVFCKYLSDGLRVAGIDVIDLGIVPTPVVYFDNTHFSQITISILKKASRYETERIDKYKKENPYEVSAPTKERDLPKN